MAKTGHARGLARRTLLDAAETLKVLAHPARLKIVELLSKDDYAVGELAEALDEAQNAVSQHLTLMYRSGMLTRRREGRTVYYRVKASNRLPLLILEAIHRQRAASTTYFGGEAI